jgi:hypothetical protein
MRRLTLQELDCVSGGGLISTDFTNQFYTDDFFIAGAAIGIGGMLLLNYARSYYPQKTQGSWQETLSCTLNTSLQWASVGVCCDVLSRLVNHVKG